MEKLSFAFTLSEEQKKKERGACCAADEKRPCACLAETQWLRRGLCVEAQWEICRLDSCDG